MSLRLGSLLPRVFVIVVVALLATATLTFAAETRRLPSSPNTPEAAAPKILLVPDVRGQAYVFAKSTLEEAGFAWGVAGGAQGYAANTVSAQSPAPGTRVYDTGSPQVGLYLTVNPGYPQSGVPENSSPFPGTPIRVVGAVTGTKPKAAPKAKPKVKPKAKPTTKPKSKPKAKPKVTPHVKPKAKAKPVQKQKPATTTARPPAFVVPGAKPEPLDEIPLTKRAANLDAWLSGHRAPTNATVKYWLYQHAWIVTGARLGWWHGADALEILIRIDQKVERMWGIGARSEKVARAALAEVRSKSK